MEPERRRAVSGRGGRPAATSRAQIVATARRLLEAEGVESLSMRRLAAAVGAAPTAIYHHVGGREQVLAAVVDDLLGEMQTVRVRGRTPLARLRSVALGIREQVLAHPYLVELAREIGQGPAAYFPGQVALARELTAAGLRGERGVRALRAILYTVGGFILLEALPLQPEELSTTAQLWSGFDDPGVDRRLTHAMGSVADTHEVFRFALDRLLRSLLAD